MNIAHSSILAFSCALLITPVSKAEERQDTINILFHQGKYNIDSKLFENRKSLSRLDSLKDVSNLKLRHIDITGAASPEGSVPLNYTLSDKRTEEVLNILIGKKGKSSLSNINITSNFIGRDWKGLLLMVKRDPDVPYKSETIGLLESIITETQSNPDKEEYESEHNLEKLKSLRDGEPYAYLYCHTFPLLRKTQVLLNYHILPTFDGEGVIPYLEVGKINPIQNYAFCPIPAQKKEGKNFYMAIKTNLLYDAAALPSLSAEFYLGKNFSVVGNWTYGWWDKNSTHRYWRAYGGDLAVRWWFGKEANKKPLTGQHIGVYGGILTYDFEFGGKGIMGGWPHETLWNRSLKMFGVEYGYSLPVAKRLNIDFTIGIGYLTGKYLKYIPDNGRYLWQSTHKLNWFGPTKAEVSLTWLIGKGNVNVKKD
ncbi:MAG: DUF3575 domain-containing protein [Bacteroidales bacterium]|nr:DUF3575 domain-containing protein [Bacteroidales bacterium]